MKTLFFAAVALALIVAACGNNDAASNMPGRAVYEAQNCSLCHGTNGEGTDKAPAIEDLKDDWKKEDLVRYFKNPMEYAKEDMRLYKQMNQYPTMMPNYDFVSEKDLGQLADYLLAK